MVAKTFLWNLRRTLFYNAREEERKEDLRRMNLVNVVFENCLPQIKGIQQFLPRAREYSNVTCLAKKVHHRQST